MNETDRKKYKYIIMTAHGNLYEVESSEPSMTQFAAMLMGEWVRATYVSEKEVREVMVKTSTIVEIEEA